MRKQGRGRLRGLTLIELMFVLALAAVMFLIGAPSLSRIVDSIRLTGGANSLFAGMIRARSEAIARRSRVVLCKSSTGSHCANTGGWEQGWIIFHDANDNAAVDSGELILLREEPLHPRLRLIGNTPVANYISYTPEGSTRYTSGAFQSGTFTVCIQSDSTVEGRSIVVYKSGRPRVSKTVVNSCA